MDFVHLHLKSEYSLLSSECRISDVVKRVKELGQSSVALTDDSVLFGAFEFSKACALYGVKPVFGCEFSVSFNEYDSGYKASKDVIKTVLLAKDKKGFINISSLSYLSSQNGYSKYIKVSDLERFSDGVMALSQTSDKTAMKKLLDIFGGDYYAELCRADEKSKAESALTLMAARGLGVGCAASNDVLYTDKNGRHAYDILCAVRENKSVYETDVKDADGRYIKSSEEMEALFADIPEALLNTAVIAGKCSFDFETGKTFLPEYDVPEGYTSDGYLKKLCLDGLASLAVPDGESGKYASRLDHELEIIVKMGYVDYYLIVMDFVTYAKNKGIPVGPGRGSGVGSLAAYLLGITEIDPIKNGLLFERFLNPERVSMPDFDIDFCDERRYEVIDYVRNKYGDENFAQIINFGTFADRQALRDAFKACGVPFSGEVPSKVASAAKLLEGRPRNISQHASGVVIVGGKNNSEKLGDHIPLYMNGQNKLTQFDMTTVEKLGLLKIDFLGLRFLTVIDNCEKSAGVKKSDYGDMDDKATYAMLSRGESCGLFQLESEGMQHLLKRASPQSLKDVAAVISLYRPGPSKSIETYLRNKKNEKNIRYINGAMKEILSETYGCIIYQEQVMEICRRIASFSYGHADVVRKAMAKKDKNVMEKERLSFVEGALNNGMTKESAEQLFDSISGFAEYAFNKSHAAAYSVLAYRTAYLKCHYPREYMAALLTSVYFSNDKKYEYFKECKRLGIGLLPPDINKSGYGFAVEDGRIRFGLMGIKNVGEQLAKEIFFEREKNGKYKSVSDLVSRMNGRASRKALISLAQCGAFISFGLNRRTVVSALEEGFYDAGGIRRGGCGQISLFTVDESPESREEYKEKEIRDHEISLTGICFDDFGSDDQEIPGNTLYLKINAENESALPYCLDLLDREKGDVGIITCYEESGKRFRYSNRCRLTKKTMDELIRRLGSGNCVIK